MAKAWYINTPEHRSWSAMKRRCYNKNAQNYSFYGARGITVCEKWQKFEAFYADMGDKPASDYTLDRIDHNGNYEPLNCRWADKCTQARNRKLPKTNTTGYRGIFKVVKQENTWIAHIYADGQNHHLGTFHNIIEAAAAYNKAAVKYHGKDASLNILSTSLF